jgi:hypothetical protein
MTRKHLEILEVCLMDDVRWAAVQRNGEGWPLFVHNVLVLLWEVRRA